MWIFWIVLYFICSSVLRTFNDWFTFSEFHKLELVILTTAVFKCMLSILCIKRMLEMVKTFGTLLDTKDWYHSAITSMLNNTFLPVKWRFNTARCNYWVDWIRSWSITFLDRIVWFSTSVPLKICGDHWVLYCITCNLVLFDRTLEMIKSWVDFQSGKP